MDMLGIKESLDRMAKPKSMRCYGHILRKNDENVIVKFWILRSAVVEKTKTERKVEKASREGDEKNGLVKEVKTVTIQNQANSVEGDNSLPDPTSDDKITLKTW